MSHHSHVLVILAAFLNCAVPAQAPDAPARPAAEGGLFSVLRETPNVGSFLRIVQLASFEKELETMSRATLFVPTDDAFEALPDSVRLRLFEGDELERRQALLRHHKVEWDVSSSTLQNVAGLMNESGRMLPVVHAAGDVWVGSAQVLRADIPAANGWIHLVDRVILPEKRTLLRALELHGEYEKFLELAHAAKLGPLLREDGPMTLFVPTDAAIAASMNKYDLDRLFEPGNEALARRFVLAHVFPSLWTARSAILAGSLPVADGEPLPVQIRHGRILLGEAILTDSDLMTDNGVIHSMDRPLFRLPAPATPEPGQTK